MRPKEVESRTLQEALLEIEGRYPIQLFTCRSALVTTVRRMKAEREWEIPIRLRSGCAVSVEHKVNANKLQEEQWERLYQRLVVQLKQVYPEHYEPLFGKEEMNEDGR